MLRHATGYALANEGTDTRLIQDFLGYASRKVVRVCLPGRSTNDQMGHRGRRGGGRHDHTSRWTTRRSDHNCSVGRGRRLEAGAQGGE
jgi:hypothetical protein